MIVAVAVAGCGESKADKAKKQVCSARSDIQKQVNDLKSLTPTTVTADKVKNSLSSIQDDLKKIRDAQGDLNAERKKQVQSANQEFSSQLQSIDGDLGSSLSLQPGCDAAAVRGPAAVDRVPDDARQDRLQLAGRHMRSPTRGRRLRGGP